MNLNKQKRCVFRVDASAKIGMGHLMRCVTLADRLHAQGDKTHFICRFLPDALAALLKSKKHELTVLPSLPSHNGEARERMDAPWDEDLQAKDADDTKAALGQWLCDWIIVDHYGLDALWESSLREHAKQIFVIDDMANRFHDCDLLLDQNVFTDAATRYTGKVPPHCKQMLGPEYALLQEDYAHFHPLIPPREGTVNRILVFFSGSDAMDMTEIAIAAFQRLECPDIVLDLVVSGSGQGLDLIREKAQGAKNIELHGHLPSLASLMARADLAIGASGATTWERCCLGLPSLAVSLADNQHSIAQQLAEQGFIRWLGRREDVSQDKILEALREIIAQGIPTQWSKNCRDLVDGKGTRRVAAVLTATADMPLQARCATPEDEMLLLRWANDPATRENSFSSERIKPGAHHDWFCARLRNVDGARLYIVETKDGVPVGQARFERKDSGWEISYSMDKLFRGLHLGQRVLEVGIKKLRSETQNALLFGRVKTSNAAGRRVFEELGFKPEPGGGGKSLTLSICSDAGSWINKTVPKLIMAWVSKGHAVRWLHDAKKLEQGDLCFFLSYSKIVPRSILDLHKHNLVVHASDLPKGRGMSPLTWQILEGINSIPVTLLEAEDAVDSGAIYLQTRLKFSGNELLDELQEGIAGATIDACTQFVENYPQIASKGMEQTGEGSVYRRRTSKDSEMDVKKTLEEQFNLLRVVDNERYPAWFSYKDRTYVLRIELQ